MPILARFLLPLLFAFSSKAGAAGAGATGSLLVLGVAAGQVPTPEGMPQWMSMLFVGVGPAVAWLFTRAVASYAGYYEAVARVKRKRVADELTIAVDLRDADSGKVHRRWLDQADEAEARAAAARAWGVPLLGHAPDREKK